jgi:hypothetical protein
MMGHLGERLTALIDGELGHTERDRAFKHLASCDACRAEADALRRLKRRIGALSEPRPSGDLMGALFGLADPGEPLAPPPPRRLTSANLPLEAELYGIDALRPADDTPGRSLPPAAAAAAFLGLTGNEPLGSRPFGHGPALGDGVALGDGSAVAIGHAPMSRGLRVRARNVMLGAAAAAAIAVGTAFFVGGDDDSAPMITPPIDMYAAEHASTSGDLVLTTNPSGGGAPAAPVYAHRTQTQYLAPAAYQP